MSVIGPGRSVSDIDNDALYPAAHIIHVQKIVKNKETGNTSNKKKQQVLKKI